MNDTPPEAAKRGSAEVAFLHPGEASMLHRLCAVSALLALAAAAPSWSDEGFDELGRISFLAGYWHLHPRTPEGGSPWTPSAGIGAAGAAHCRWHSGNPWLDFDVAMVMPGVGPYELYGGVTFDPESGQYVAYAVSSLAERVTEYRGRWDGETTVVFDSRRSRGGRHLRFAFARDPDGSVVFSASESPDGAVYRTHVEALLEKLAEPAGLDEADGRNATRTSPDGGGRLDAIVLDIRAADYRGQRAELLRLSAALEEVADPRLSAYRLYWQGFAQWRRALNGFNETPVPADLGEDLAAAVRSFRAALSESPGWIEAKIGIVGSLSSMLFLSRDDQERTRETLTEYVPVMREVISQGAENPRALWLIGGKELGAPPPHGGDPARAAATLRRGLEAARREAMNGGPRPAHVPSWGGAECLMSLAWLYSHSALEDRPLALAYAEATLTLVPHWHYVARVLLPQIEALHASVGRGEGLQAPARGPDGGTVDPHGAP